MEPRELIRTEPIEQLLDKIGAETVFGTPTTENGVTLIPVAQAEFGFGYGGGYGHRANGVEASNDEMREETDDIEDSSGEGGGSGSGGGGGGRSTPRGFIRITPDAVTYEPIVDETRIPLAAIFLSAWSIFWITATVRVIARSVAKTKQMRLKQA